MTNPAENADTLSSKALRYTGYAVFRREASLDGVPDSAVAELSSLSDGWAEDDIVVRGFYDVSGMRADADVMVWWHGPTAEGLQAAYRQLRGSRLGAATTPRWSAIGLHRDSEFNKTHLPAFIEGKEPRAWVAVYPYIRSYDWYLLPTTERAALLREHGAFGRDYPEVLSNTVAGFALGDYEWLLAVESDRLDQIVDMMRHLRGSATRRHVRLEVPFFTGRRVDEAGAIAAIS